MGNHQNQPTDSAPFAPRRRARRVGALVAVVAGLGMVAGAASAATLFDDVPTGAFYAEPVEWAAANGITTGRTATTFEPDTGVTRGESVTFLKRYHDEFVAPLVAAVPEMLWVAVGGDGTAARGSAGVESETTSTGFYEVDFGVDITGCTYAATIAEADPVEPTTTILLRELTISLQPKPGDANVLLVHTGDADGSAASARGSDFHLQVNCWT